MSNDTRPHLPHGCRPRKTHRQCGRNNHQSSSPIGPNSTVRFPEEIWPDPNDRQLVQDLIAVFSSTPLVITDKLTNSLWLSDSAESLLGERAEALVNRVSYSLLGFEDREKQPARLVDALLGEGDPWRGVVHLPTATGTRLVFVEASAVSREGRFVCGVLRFNLQEQHAS